MLDSIYRFDFSILDALQSIHSPVLNVIMMVITYFAEVGWGWIALTVIMLRFPKRRKMGLASGVSLAIMLLINDVTIKSIVGRPRPYTLREDIDTIIPYPMGTSFPSGHTCASFSAATAIFLYDKKLGAFAYLLAALIGFSRNYFYVHYPTDVICGALLGIILGIIGTAIVRKLIVPRFGEKLKLPKE